MAGSPRSEAAFRLPFEAALGRERSAAWDRALMVARSLYLYQTSVQMVLNE